MPGWIIQGVRGEGKSLCAVGKIKEYMQRGRPVATNLTLYLDKFLPADNDVISFRLPDHPRLEDLQLLPPAYDPKYKGEDMNGLLVLDELGTWLNARNWNEKTRLGLLNWLFLSRKYHWDLILLAQDFEMIDAQVRTSLCDFLVQASRLDRQKIPYFASILKMLGFSGNMPEIHRYHVFYGMSTNQQPQATWSYTGKDFYDGYDTNQIFKDGMEALNGTLIDMRATYSYIPANYLTRNIYIQRLNNRIDELKKLTVLNPEIEAPPMAKKNLSKETSYLKIGLLCLALVVFVGWRLMSGFSLPKAAVTVQAPAVPVASSLAPAATVPASTGPAVESVYMATQTNSIIEHLLKTYRPRLSTTAYSPQTGFVGNIDFYDNFELIETYKIKELHALGVTLIRKPYGVDLLYAGKTFIVSAWRLPDHPQADSPVDNQSVSNNVPVVSAKPSVSDLL